MQPGPGSGGDEAGEINLVGWKYTVENKGNRDQGVEGMKQWR